MPITTAGGLADATVTSINSAQAGVTTALNNLDLVLSGFSFSSYGAGVTPPTGGTYVAFADADATIKTALAAFDSEMAAITWPTVPTLDTTDILAKSSRWNEQSWTDLKALLTAFTSDITSADDVDTVIVKLTSDTARLETAIFQKTLARRQSILRDSISAGGTMTGNAGFTFPNSMTQALTAKATQDFNFGLSEESNKLIDVIMTWAKNNYQFSAGKQLEAHSSDVDFNIRYSGVLLQSFTSQAEVIVKSFREELEGVAVRAGQSVKSLLTRLEIVKGNAAQVEAADRFNLDVFRAEVQEAIEGYRLTVNNQSTIKTQEIQAASAAVTAATHLAASANQIAVGVLSGA